MKTVNEAKKGGKVNKIKKVKKVRKITKKNAFGFREESNKAIISDMFLENGITLHNAASKVMKKFDKVEAKAISMVLGMVKRLIKKGHKVEVVIKAIPKIKNDTKKSKSRPQKITEAISDKIESNKDGGESLQEQQIGTKQE